MSDSMIDPRLTTPRVAEAAFTLLSFGPTSSKGMFKLALDRADPAGYTAVLATRDGVWWARAEPGDVERQVHDVLPMYGDTPSSLLRIIEERISGREVGAGVPAYALSFVPPSAPSLSAYESATLEDSPAVREAEQGLAPSSVALLDVTLSIGPLQLSWVFTLYPFDHATRNAYLFDWMLYPLLVAAALSPPPAESATRGSSISLSAVNAALHSQAGLGGVLATLGAAQAHKALVASATSVVRTPSALGSAPPAPTLVSSTSTSLPSSLSRSTTSATSVAPGLHPGLSSASGPESRKRKQPDNGEGEEDAPHQPGLQSLTRAGSSINEETLSQIRRREELHAKLQAQTTKARKKKKKKKLFA